MHGGKATGGVNKCNNRFVVEKRENQHAPPSPTSLRIKLPPTFDFGVTSRRVKNAKAPYTYKPISHRQLCLALEPSFV